MESSQYYSITTRRFVLRCAHPEWLGRTQNLYNEVILFYYNLFLDKQEQGEEWEVLNSREAMRRLETLTVEGRNKCPVDNPLPWGGIPLYFRRSAINGAVTAAKGYLAGRDINHRTENFHCAVTFYKGAYRDLTEQSIELKVWNGEAWTWLHCRLSGNEIPDYAVPMSPSLILKGREQYLNLPVKVRVSDGRKARERIRQMTNVCAVQFSNNDVFVTAVVLNEAGTQENVHFFRGGKEYRYLCNKTLEKIEYSESKMGIAGMENQTEEAITRKNSTTQLYNRKYWKKLKNLSEYYAHKISRQLVDYCVEQNVGILILPEYDKRYTRCVMYSVGNWSPIHLSSRIRKQLFYKAWKAGILVLETGAKGCSNVCSVCGLPVRKLGSDCRCENGHQFNRSLNTARNLGRKCLDSFKR